MKPGYLSPLFLLPIDQRDSFVDDLFHFQFPLSDVQHQKVVAVKQIVYEALLASVARRNLNAHAGIMIDEQFGSTILRDAKKHNLVTALAVEKSSSYHFEFEYGAQFAQHIELFQPTFVKVQLRYNPEDTAGYNEQQRIKLLILSEYCQNSARLLMLELLVPATKDQLRWYRSDLHAYDRKCRPDMMVQAICEMQDFGIEPDVWIVEAMDQRNDYLRIVEAATRNGRDNTGCLVLGQGENEQKISEWLIMAGSVPGFIGFSVGRTTYWNALSDLGSRLMDRQSAVKQIAQRYQMWINLFENGPTTEKVVPVRKFTT